MSAAPAYAIHTCINCLLIKTRYHAGIALQFQYEIRKRGLHDSLFPQEGASTPFGISQNGVWACNGECLAGLCICNPADTFGLIMFAHLLRPHEERCGPSPRWVECDSRATCPSRTGRVLSSGSSDKTTSMPPPSPWRTHAPDVFCAEPSLP